MLRGRASYIGQAPGSPPVTPQRSPGKPARRNRPSDGPSANAIALTAAVVFLFLSLVAVATVFGVLETRDERRYERTRTDIKQLRGGLEPIGFLVRKRGTQSVATSTFTTITAWSTTGGAPAYDASNGAFNFATGVWTTPTDAKYQVSASVCWTNGALGLRQLIILTNLTGGVVPLTSTVAAIGVICNSISVTMDLPQSTTVRLQGLRTTGGVELIGTSSTFSIERIGVMDL